MLITIIVVSAWIFTAITVLAFIALLGMGLRGNTENMQGLWSVFFIGLLVSALLWYLYYNIIVGHIYLG